MLSSFGLFVCLSLADSTDFPGHRLRATPKLYVVLQVRENVRWLATGFP